jgi:signal transduction histidine kinase
MSERPFRIIVLTIIVSAHYVSFLQLQEAAVHLNLPVRWSAQSLMLLGISLSLSAAIAFARKPVSRWIFTALAAFVIILVSFPTGPYLGPELSLFTSLILLTSCFLSLASSITVSAVALWGIFFLKRPLRAWGLSVPAPALNSLIAFSVAIIVFAGICNLLNLLQKRLLAIKRFRESVEEVSQRLAQANLRLQEYAVLSEEAAITSERKRLARDLHDTIAYTLTNLIMMMEASIDMAPVENAKLRRMLTRARDLSKEGLVEARRVIDALRPSQLSKVNGLPAIFRLIKTFEKATRIRTKLHFGDAPWNFGDEEDIIVYRLVQEGMTNAIRHGNAKNITISMSREKGGVRVNIRDDGIGFAELKEGYGITGMRERIEKLGGSLELTSKPMDGTLLSTWLPIPESHAS